MIDINHLQATDLESTLSEEALTYYIGHLEKTSLMRNVEDVVTYLVLETFQSIKVNSYLEPLDVTLKLDLVKERDTYKLSWWCEKNDNYVFLGSYNFLTGELVAKHLEAKSFHFDLDLKATPVGFDTKVKTLTEEEVDKKIDGFLNLYNELFEGKFIDSFEEKFGRKPVEASPILKFGEDDYL